MPIIEMCDANTPGAERSDYWSQTTGHDIYLRATYAGLCLCERERNGYDDSDFYMVIWDEEQGKPREIMFATTRGWSYPCMGSFVDATPEIRAKYDAWCKRQDELHRLAQRRARIKLALANRKILSEVCREFDLPFARMIKLRRELGNDLGLVLGLFGSRIRSKIKLSFRAQVIAWAGKPSNYPTPLSRKQMSMLREWAAPIRSRYNPYY